MSTRFCPSCGAEYVAAVTECTDCQVPLADAQPGAPDAGGDGDEDWVSFELPDWSEDDRQRVVWVLRGQNIPFEWEETDLVVREEDADAVESILDEIEGVEELEIEEDEEVPENEASYEMVSELFLAADRLVDAPDDGAVVGDFAIAAEAIADTAPPYGFDPKDWNKVRELAATVQANVEQDAEEDVIVGDARLLRDALRRFV